MAPRDGQWCLISGQDERWPDGDTSAALWAELKGALGVPGFFEKHVKGKVVPGAPETARFRGTVVSSTPSVLSIAITDQRTPEVDLILSTPLEPPVPPGARIEFQAVAAGFVASSFLLRVEALPRIADPRQPGQKEQIH